MRRIGTVVLVACVVGVGVAAAVDTLRKRGDTGPVTGETLGSQPEPGRFVVWSGRAFSVRRMLAVGEGVVAGEFCVELLREGGRTHSCSDGSSLQVVRETVGAGQTLLFGLLPTRTARVWIVLEDRRIVDGRLPSVPETLAASLAVYVLPVASLAPGEVIAVDASGFLVDHAHVDTSTEPGRLVGVVDAYGNIIGFVPNGWALPSPGPEARVDDIRLYLVAPVTRVHPAAAEWWARRPRRKAASAAVRTWWLTYPVTGSLVPRNQSD